MGREHDISNLAVFWATLTVNSWKLELDWIKSVDFSLIALRVEISHWGAQVCNSSMIWVESINKREKGIIWIFKIHIKISCKCLLHNGEFNLMGVALRAYKKYFFNVSFMFSQIYVYNLPYVIYLHWRYRILYPMPFLLTDKKISISFWIVIGKNNKNRLSWLMLQSYGLPKTTLQNFAMRMNLQHTILLRVTKAKKDSFHNGHHRGQKLSHER